MKHSRKSLFPNCILSPALLEDATAVLAMPARSCNVDANQADKPANARTNEQHGHNKAAGYGRAGHPAGADEIHEQHQQTGAIANLAVGTTAEKVHDRFFA